MQSIFLTLLTISYAAVGVISTIAYWPTIKDLLAKKPSANTASYVLWTSTTLVALLYGIFVLSDWLFCVIGALSFLSCATILALRLRLKKSTAR